MSAVLLRAVQTAPSQVLAVWRAMPGAYLLLGRAPGPLPKAGSARLARHSGAPGMFRTFLWPLGPDQAVGYLVVIRLPDRLVIGDESEVVLRGARGADRDFALRLAPICEGEEFGRQLASLAGACAASLARFVLDLMRSDEDADVRRPILLLESFLHHAARHEGCVELLLEVPDRALLLQGWGPPTGSDVEIVLTGSGMIRHPVQVGVFPRDDIKAPLTGSVLALPVEVVGDLANTQSIFLLTQDEILCRRVLDSRVLDPAASAGQIRHLLAKLVCPPALAATLHHALRPQYEGVDTLNTSERRVRGALDFAVVAEDAGVFLSGWLFDPACHVAQIDFCTGADSVRIDVDMVRVERDDVVLAFQDDPSFPHAARSDWGFAVRADSAGPVPTRPYLRFTFDNDDIAFMPLVLRSAAEPGVRGRLCNSVDMHKQSGVEIVQHHLAPFLSRTHPPKMIGAKILLRGPLDRPHGVVVPLASSILPRAVIAGLLRDPLDPDEQIIVVCGPEWRAGAIDALIELLRFYALPATVVTLPDGVGPMDAVVAASVCSQAATFLVLSPTASITTAGSRKRLREASEQVDAVCPTVLYEDGSVRFAGSSELVSIGRAPFARIQARWLGLSADHVAASGPADAAGGTLACCLLHRHALPAVERARWFSTDFGQEVALFCELQGRGSRVAWHPTVVIGTAEEGDPGSTTKAAALVDNWTLRESWGDKNCAS